MLYPEANLIKRIIRQGTFAFPDGTSLIVPNSLFDTGALGGDYISKEYFEKHIDVLNKYFISSPSSVILADDKSKINIIGILNLPISFLDKEDNKYEANLSFHIFSMKDKDVIIGIKSIIVHFLNLFIEYLVTPVEQYSENPNFLNNLSTDTLLDPWSTLPLSADEEINDYEPCSHTSALHFLMITPEDAFTEFKDQFSSQVSEEFSKTTNVIDLLLRKGPKVFIPQNWTGINGIEDLELSWKEDQIPDYITVKTRFINPALFPNVEKECQRLQSYFYIPSSSPIASPLVVAPKATKPFIRFCGDYVEVNKYINNTHQTIPDVRKALDKIVNFKIFLDVDLTNAFHQIKLATKTSERLSVKTPFGQFRPLFMPEGIGPASGILQWTVSTIFADFHEFMICIFDNLLVLATDYDDAYIKLEKVLDRCIQRNVYLKFPKTFLGFTSVKFFGYLISDGKYCIDSKRIEAIKQINFPSDKKSMRSFLGVANFCSPFIPHYSSKSAELMDMTHDGFNWDKSTWEKDYLQCFEDLKFELASSISIHFPDYSLKWILRSDASIVGVGAVLLQVRETDKGIVLEPLGFASAKFSGPATKWSTIEQELFAVVFAVKNFKYYLCGRDFIVETDHNNLKWMEASEVPKITRWRIFLQSFSFVVRHIPGYVNLVADYFSRNPLAISDEANPVANAVNSLWISHCNSLNAVASLEDTSEADEVTFDSTTLLPHSPEDALSIVHNSRVGHMGSRVTWERLNKLFPSHSISFNCVKEFVSACPVCQKDRLGMTTSLVPIVRHLKVDFPSAMIGIDSLAMTPRDAFGNDHICVIVNFFTKHVALYPTPTVDAKNAAASLFQYFSTFGIVDAIISDPGVENRNEIISYLTKWFGISHKFSLVDRHESNGVEGSNKQILRHLRALVLEERVGDRWSDPTILSIISHIMNSSVNSETGFSPFSLTFGSSTRFRLPSGTSEDFPTYLKDLDADITALTNASRRFQAKLVAKRTAENGKRHHTFQPTDLILVDLGEKFRPNKLSPAYVGPFEVLSQFKNDVTAKHVILGHVSVFHVSRIKLFIGTLEDAKKIALADNNQYEIDYIGAYCGDPLKRTTTEYHVHFKDGSALWIMYQKDLHNTQQYEEYVNSIPELKLLAYSLDISKQRISEINKSPITEVKPGDHFYANLRCYGHAWYDSLLSVENRFHVVYLVEFIFGDFADNKRTKINVQCPLFGDKFVANHLTVKMYASTYNKDYLPKNYVILNKSILKKFPALDATK